MISKSGEPFILDFSGASHEPNRAAWHKSRDGHHDFYVMSEFDTLDSRIQNEIDQKSMMAAICDMLIADKVIHFS